MNTKKFILASIVVFIVYEILNYVIHSFILGNAYMATASLWRPMEEMNSMMWIMWLGDLVKAFVFVYIFTKGIEGKGWAEACVTASGWDSMYLWEWVSGPIPGCPCPSAWRSSGSSTASSSSFYAASPPPCSTSRRNSIKSGSWIRCIWLTGMGLSKKSEKRKTTEDTEKMTKVSMLLLTITYPMGSLCLLSALCGSSVAF